MSAQTFEVVTPLRFPETSASVRAAALGAVSIPLESDPASVMSNPAAIASLARPAISMAASSTSYEYKVPVYGGGELVAETNDDAGLRHAVFAMPVGSFAFAASYRQEPGVRVGRPFVTRGNGQGTPIGVDCYRLAECGLSFFMNKLAAARTETRYGAATAWRRGTFAIGAGADVVELEERIQTPRALVDPTTPATAYDQLGRRLAGREVVLRGGLTWQVVPRLTVAASYSEGGTFDRETTLCTTPDVDSSECSSALVTVHRTSIRRPDALRAGLAVRVTDNLTVAGEGVRRNYSVLSHESYSHLGLPLDLPYLDVIEPHAGVEYRWGDVAVRAGWWRDPSRFDIEGAVDTISTRDVDHVTLGAGFVRGRTRFDVALDDARRTGVRSVTLGITQMF